VFRSSRFCYFGTTDRNSETKKPFADEEKKRCSLQETNICIVSKKPSKVEAREAFFLLDEVV